LHEHIERLVDRDPDRVVLAIGSRTLSAADLDRFANRIAWSLRDRGVRHGDLVAVALPRDVTLVPALLGVLKLGAAYIPVDPHLPAARIASMLDDSGVGHVLTSNAWAHAEPYTTRICLDPHEVDGLNTETGRPPVEA